MNKENKEWEEFDKKFYLNNGGFCSKYDFLEIKSFISKNFISKSLLLDLIEGEPREFSDRESDEYDTGFGDALDKIKAKIEKI